MNTQELKLSDYEWRDGRNIKQFMSTTVIEPDDKFRTLASGLASINTETETGVKITILAPILIVGYGDYYEVAWEGEISVDERQQTHIVFEKNGEVTDIKQVSNGIEELNLILQNIYRNEESKKRLFKSFDYVKDTSVVDVEDSSSILTLPIRFFATLYTNANRVLNICKPTDELIFNGAKFVKRGEYTHFLILVTNKNRWLVCIRTSDTQEEPNIDGYINESVRTFDYGEEDKIISLLMETGVDPFDSVLDVINETIANEIMKIEEGS